MFYRIFVFVFPALLVMSGIAQAEPKVVTVVTAKGTEYALNDAARKVFCSATVGKDSLTYMVRDGEHSATAVMTVLGGHTRTEQGGRLYFSTVEVAGGTAPQTPFFPKGNPSAPHMFLEHCAALVLQMPKAASDALTVATVDEAILP
jgi:hypothetical protein